MIVRVEAPSARVAGGVLAAAALAWLVVIHQADGMTSAPRTLEKAWRHGARVAVAVGVALIVLGLLAPWHPEIVPGLHRAPAPMGGGM